MHSKDKIYSRLMQDGVRKVLLKLPSESRERTLGEIQRGSLPGITFTTWRYPRRGQVMKVSNEVALNYRMFDIFDFDNIVIETDNVTLYTTRDYFLFHSGIRHFKKSGYERQRFMHQSLFDTSPDMPKAKRWAEQHRTLQKAEPKKDFQLALSI